MPVTLKDIARQTGYSITTISRALAGYNDVNEKTRERIVLVAERMGYQPNLVARTLQSQRTYAIGMITPPVASEAEEDFFSVLLRGVAYVATEHHYDVLFSPQMTEDDELLAYKRLVGGKRVDGVVVARTALNDPRITYLQEVGLPFVVSGRSAQEGNDFPYIDADNQRGLDILTQHFIDYGHEEIGLILPPRELVFGKQRHQGYREALERNGIMYRDDYVCYASAMNRPGGYHATHKLMQDQPQLTAIIGGTDLIALGTIHALQELGHEVGVDIAVGGFDDIPIAQYASPPLTTVRQPIFEIGKMLASMLIKILTNESHTDTQVLIAPELVIRASSGKKR